MNFNAIGLIKYSFQILTELKLFIKEKKIKTKTSGRY